MFHCPRLCPLGVPLGPTRLLAGLLPGRVGGGGAPDAGSGPSPREFPHGGADACTPRQGVSLLYGPSICTRSVQMDLRRNQVRRPFPTPGSGTLWVSGESLRDSRVSCLPRWTVCPTRSPSQDTNRSTCRGECSSSGPLATPPGRCHLGLLANGPGRNPPYCSRSDGADTDTGGAPKPQRSGTSPALFAGSCHPGPPPLVPASQLSSPGASPCPTPLAVPPGSRHVPSAPAVCPCSGVLVSFVVRFVLFFFSAPPMSPRCLLAVLALFVGGRRRRGQGGGGRSRCPPVPRPLGMLKQVFLGRFEPVVACFGPWKIPKCLEHGPFRDQKWVKNGSKTHFSKSDPGPFGMLKQVVLAHFEPVVTPFGPGKNGKCLEKGPFWNQKWVKNGSKKRFSKSDLGPFGMLKQLS